MSFGCVTKKEWLNIVLNVLDVALFGHTETHLGRKVYVLSIRASSEWIVSAVVAFDCRKHILAIVCERAARCIVAKLTEVPAVDEEVEDGLELSDVQDELVDHLVAAHARVAQIDCSQVGEGRI